MKKMICIMGFFAIAALVSGCDDNNQPEQTKVAESGFIGHWKSVSKDDGSALHPKFSSVLDVQCTQSACHIIEKKKSMLSDDELVNSSDWSKSDSSTLTKVNGIATIYLKEDKLIANNVLYQRQKE